MTGCRHSWRTDVAARLVLSAALAFCGSQAASAAPDPQSLVAGTSPADTVRLQYGQLRSYLGKLVEVWTNDVAVPRCRADHKSEFETDAEHDARMTEWDTVHQEGALAAIQGTCFIVGGIPLSRGKYVPEEGRFEYLRFAPFSHLLGSGESEVQRGRSGAGLDYWSRSTFFESLPAVDSRATADDASSPDRKEATLLLRDVEVPRESAEDWALAVERTEVLGRIEFRLRTFSVVALPAEEPDEFYIYSKLGMSVGALQLVSSADQEVLLELRGKQAIAASEQVAHERQEVSSAGPSSREPDLVHGTVKQWLAASEAQRDAAAARMVSNLGIRSSQAERQRVARELSICITEASSPEWSSMAVSEVAAACALLMGY